MALTENRRKAPPPGAARLRRESSVKAMDLRAAALPPGAAKKRAEAVLGLARWDRAYPASAISIRDAWIVSGRTGRDRALAVGYEPGKRPRWLPDLRGVEKSA